MKKEIIVINDIDLFIETLSSTIQGIVREELANPKLKSMKKMEENAYLTRKEVCDYLHISSSTLHRCVNTGLFNCYKIGRRSLFKLQEISAASTKMNV